MVGSTWFVGEDTAPARTAGYLDQKLRIWRPWTSSSGTTAWTDRLRLVWEDGEECNPHSGVTHMTRAADTTWRFPRPVSLMGVTHVTRAADTTWRFPRPVSFLSSTSDDTGTPQLSVLSTLYLTLVPLRTIQPVLVHSSRALFVFSEVDDTSTYRLSLVSVEMSMGCSIASQKLYSIGMKHNA